MDLGPRKRSLITAGLVHPRPMAVTGPLFDGSLAFFLPEDKVQVKYEMLRSHLVEGETVARAARVHGYSRANFYLIQASFEQHGMLGLLDERRGRKGPLKVTPAILAFVQAADPELSGAALAAEIEKRFGVHLHRRTVERVRR